MPAEGSRRVQPVPIKRKKGGGGGAVFESFLFSKTFLKGFPSILSSSSLPFHSLHNDPPFAPPPARPYESNFSNVPSVPQCITVDHRNVPVCESECSRLQPSLS